jgi:titin
MEQAANNDFQDVVLVVENVMPADGVLAPQNLMATAGPAPGTVTLHWGDASDNETGFVIERSRRKDGVFEQIGTTGAGVTGYVDGRGAGGRTYYYRVRAVNGGRSSLASNRAVAVVP